MCGEEKKRTIGTLLCVYTVVCVCLCKAQKEMYLNEEKKRAKLNEKEKTEKNGRSKKIYRFLNGPFINKKKYMSVI